MGGASAVLLLALAVPLPLGGEPLSPPVARKHPYVIELNGNTRTDEYYWLRDDTRTNPDVLHYLKAENDYLAAALAHTQPLQEQLFAEMSARLDPDDTEVPWREGRYWYAWRYRKGQEHPLLTRRSGAPHAPEVVILDANQQAGTDAFYEIGGWEVSRDGKLLVFTEDRTGREIHDLRVRDLVSDALLPDHIPGAFSQVAWANDNRSLYYIRLDEALRPNRVYRHRLGANADADVLVYEEKDRTFDMSLKKTRDANFVMINLVSTLTTETRLVDANAAAATSAPFRAREKDHRYSVEIDGDEAWILSNWDAPNYRLLRTPLRDSADKSRWKEVLPHRTDVPLFDLALFRGFAVVNEVHGGTLKLRVLGRAGDEDFFIEGDEPAYSAMLGDNAEIETDTLRYVYTSLATPATVHDVNLRTGEDVTLKRDFAGTDPSPQSLRTERLAVTARDGALIPVTLLYAAGARPDGTRAVFLHGYGAYAAVFNPEFNREVLSLVKRGFVYAIAHIRGGGEFGRAWYDAGRVLNKKNTFTDFTDAARGLVKTGWAAPDRVIGFGRSAGGLLIGAVANAQPNPFALLVTEVPFVDLVTTMMDESIPLTSFEWEEWGDPHNPAHYDYMLSYSPYDQVAARVYPHMLVTTGLWDARVQYWEPAKWVARLRANKRGDSRLFFSTDMSAGHAGLAGRYQRLRETALEYAFILNTLGAGSPQ